MNPEELSSHVEYTNEGYCVAWNEQGLQIRSTDYHAGELCLPWDRVMMFAEDVKSRGDVGFEWRTVMETPMTVERVTRFFGFCTLLALGVLLAWFLLYLVFRDVAFDVHGSIFALERKEFDLIIYSSFAFFKLLAICLFVIPWVSLKLAGRSG